MGLTARSDSSPIPLPPRCLRAPTGKTLLPRGFVFLACPPRLPPDARLGAMREAAMAALAKS
jgi:hypothetical protein